MANKYANASRCLLTATLLSLTDYPLVCQCLIIIKDVAYGIDQKIATVAQCKLFTLFVPPDTETFQPRFTIPCEILALVCHSHVRRRKDSLADTMPLHTP